MVKDDVLKLLFIDVVVDDKQSELIDVIIKLTERRLLQKLPKEIKEVPHELQFIVTEISVKRYNRIGSEGMISESTSGHSMTFDMRDFDEYEGDIARFIAGLEDSNSDHYMVRFL